MINESRIRDHLTHHHVRKTGLAALTKPGRVGTARRCGSGERDEKPYERNQCVKLRNRCAGSNLADMGRCAVHVSEVFSDGDSVTG